MNLNSITDPSVQIRFLQEKIFLINKTANSFREEKIDWAEMKILEEEMNDLKRQMYNEKTPSVKRLEVLQKESQSEAQYKRQDIESNHKGSSIDYSIRRAAREANVPEEEIVCMSKYAKQEKILLTSLFKASFYSTEEKFLFHETQSSPIVLVRFFRKVSDIALSLIFRTESWIWNVHPSSRRFFPTSKGQAIQYFRNLRNILPKGKLIVNLNLKKWAVNFDFIRKTQEPFSLKKMYFSLKFKVEFNFFPLLPYCYLDTHIFTCDNPELYFQYLLKIEQTIKDSSPSQHKEKKNPARYLEETFAAIYAFTRLHLGKNDFRSTYRELLKLQILDAEVEKLGKKMPAYDLQEALFNKDFKKYCQDSSALKEAEENLLSIEERMKNINSEIKKIKAEKRIQKTAVEILKFKIANYYQLNAKPFFSLLEKRKHTE